MEILGERAKEWSLKVTCTGEGWCQKHLICGSELLLNPQDVLERKRKGDYDETVASYGFICPVCHCFTEIPGEKIPGAIKGACPQVASKESDDYSSLSKEEKILSKEL